MHEQNDRTTDGERPRPKVVYTIIDKPGREKGHWCRIGIAFVNRDQSLNVKLDAVPVNGTLHIRDQEERDQDQERTRTQVAPSSTGARRDDFALRSPVAAGGAR